MLCYHGHITLQQSAQAHVGLCLLPVTVHYTIGTLHYTTSTFRVVSVSSNTLNHTTGTCWAVSVSSNTLDHTTGTCWAVSVSINTLDHTTGTCWAVSVFSNTSDHTTGICWAVSVSSNILDHSTGTCWSVSVSSNIFDLPQAHVRLCVFPVTHSILHCGQSSLGHGVIIQVQVYNLKTRLADSENKVLMHVRYCKRVCTLTCMFPKKTLSKTGKVIHTLGDPKMCQAGVHTESWIA